MRFFGFTNLYLAGVFLAMMVDRLADVPVLGGATLWMVIGTALIGIGGIAVVASEISSLARAPGVSRFRQLVEVALTALFAFGITWASWLTVLASTSV